LILLAWALKRRLGWLGLRLRLRLVLVGPAATTTTTTATAAAASATALALAVARERGLGLAGGFGPRVFDLGEVDSVLRVHHDGEWVGWGLDLGQGPDSVHEAARKRRICQV